MQYKSVTDDHDNNLKVIGQVFKMIQVKIMFISPFAFPLASHLCMWLLYFSKEAASNYISTVLCESGPFDLHGLKRGL